MAEDVFLIRLAASGAMVERLRHAQDLLSHAVARGDLAEVFDRGLKALIVDLERKKFGANGCPRGKKRAALDSAGTGARCEEDTPARPHTRYIAKAVKRTVTTRDDERCTYVAPDGRPCEARAFLQFHHRRPYEVGGGATVENIALLCAAHNQYEADVYFAPFRRALGERDLSERDSIRPGADEPRSLQAG
jgi:hypothetical protein